MAFVLATPPGRPLGRGVGLGEGRFGKPQDVLGVRNLKTSRRSPCADERPLRAVPLRRSVQRLFQQRLDGDTAGRIVATGCLTSKGSNQRWFYVLQSKFRTCSQRTSKSGLYHL